MPSFGSVNPCTSNHVFSLTIIFERCCHPHFSQEQKALFLDPDAASTTEYLTNVWSSLSFNVTSSRFCSADSVDTYSCTSSFDNYVKGCLGVGIAAYLLQHDSHPIFFSLFCVLVFDHRPSTVQHVRHPCSTAHTSAIIQHFRHLPQTMLMNREMCGIATIVSSGTFFRIFIAAQWMWWALERDVTSGYCL